MRQEPKLSEYEITRIRKTSKYAIFCDGEYICQMTKREAEAWVFRAKRSDAIDLEVWKERQKYRRERVQEYLAERAKRTVEIQLELF